MKNLTTVTGKLEVLHRLPQSYFGNPRFALRIGGYTCRTAVDSSFGYSVSNHDGKIVTATIGDHYGYSTLNTLSAVK